MRVEGRTIYYSLEDFKHPRIFDCPAEGSTLISLGTTNPQECKYLYLKDGRVSTGEVPTYAVLRHAETYGPIGGKRLRPE